jgi:hypothetical protein
MNIFKKVQKLNHIKFKHRILHQEVEGFMFVHVNLMSDLQPRRNVHTP